MFPSLGTTFSGVVSEGWAGPYLASSMIQLTRSLNLKTKRRMRRHAFRRVLSSRSCVGRAHLRRFAKCQHVFCMTNMVKSWHGDSKPRIQVPCRAHSDVNGTHARFSVWSVRSCFFIQGSNSFSNRVHCAMRAPSTRDYRNSQ